MRVWSSPTEIDVLRIALLIKSHHNGNSCIAFLDLSHSNWSFVCVILSCMRSCVLVEDFVVAVGSETLLRDKGSNLSGLIFISTCPLG